MKKRSIVLGIFMLFASFILTSSWGYAKEEISTTRISGKNRYSTSIEVSKLKFKKAQAVVLINGAKFADGTSAPLLAKKVKGPLLLTRGVHFEKELRDEINRLGAKNIYIIGGENCVSTDFEKELKKNYSVTRLAGKDRFETSLKVADFILKDSSDKNYLIVNAFKVEDGIAAAAYGLSKNAPAILMNKEEGPKNVEDWIDKNIGKRTIIGPEDAISPSLQDRIGIADRVAGRNIYELSANIAKLQKPSNEVVFVNGYTMVDGLSALSLLNEKINTLYFVDKNRIPPAVEEALKLNFAKKINLVGGEAVLDFDSIKIERKEVSLDQLMKDQGLKKDPDQLRAYQDHPQRTYLRGANITKAYDFPEVNLITVRTGKQIPNMVGNIRLLWDLSISFPLEKGEYCHLGIDLNEKVLQIQKGDPTEYVEYKVDPKDWDKLEEYVGTLVAQIEK